jgi:hypothetical protein
LNGQLRSIKDVRRFLRVCIAILQQPPCLTDERAIEIAPFCFDGSASSARGFATLLDDGNAL